jgi:hypothetical protein
MSTMETDRLVDEYLARLEAAAAHMQRARRTELVSEIREHIETALREEEAAGEAAVRNVLERLGPPEEIVEAAEPPVPAGDGHGRAGKLEVAALILLVVPLVGWIVGVVLVLVSHAWSSREKLFGVALALLPALVPLLVLTAGAESGGTVSTPVGDEPEASGDSGLGPLEIASLVVGVAAGLPSAVYLGTRLRRPRGAVAG